MAINKPHGSWQGGSMWPNPSPWCGHFISPQEVHGSHRESASSASWRTMLTCLSHHHYASPKALWKDGYRVAIRKGKWQLPETMARRLRHWECAGRALAGSCARSFALLRRAVSDPFPGGLWLLFEKNCNMWCHSSISIKYHNYDINLKLKLLSMHQNMRNSLHYLYVKC